VNRCFKYLPFYLLLIAASYAYADTTIKETYLDKQASRTQPKFELRLNKCIESSIKSLDASSGNFDELINAFKEDGDQCFKDFSWSNSKEIIGPSICQCATNDKFLKFKQNQIVNANIDELVNNIIRIETLKAFRASYYANFETCKHLIKLHKEGKISSAEFASVGPCSADAFTSAVFGEVNDRPSCNADLKNEGLEVLFGTSDQKKAKDFLQSIGNSIALNTISPEDLDKGYCLPKDAVSEFADPPIETASILGPESMINPFNPMVSEVLFTNINEMMLETQMFTSSQPEILNNLFNQDGTPFTPRELRGARSIGDDFMGFLNKNPLARIAMSKNKTFALLGKMPPNTWKKFIETEDNLKAVGAEANKFCSAITQKEVDETGKTVSSKALKQLGDVICGTHKPKIDPRTYVSQIAPRIHTALGPERGKIASLSYSKRMYCKEVDGPEGIKLKFDETKGTGGDFENDIAKIGLSTKSDIEKKYIKDDSHPTPSEYDILNKGTCHPSVFGGCEKDPTLKKCTDIETIISNTEGRLEKRLKELNIDLALVSFFGESGNRDKFETIDELVKALKENPEKYNILAESNISDEEFYEVKSLLTVLYSMKNKQSDGETKTAYFETIGKSPTTGVDPLDIMSNASSTQATTINQTYTENQNRTPGTPEREIQFDRQLDSPEVRQMVSRPTPSVEFSNETSEVFERQSGGSNETGPRTDDFSNESIPQIGNNDQSVPTETDTRTNRDTPATTENRTSFSSDPEPTPIPQNYTDQGKVPDDSSSGGDNNQTERSGDSEIARSDNSNPERNSNDVDTEGKTVAKKPSTTKRPIPRDTNFENNTDLGVGPGTGSNAQANNRRYASDYSGPQTGNSFNRSNPFNYDPPTAGNNNFASNDDINGDPQEGSEKQFTGKSGSSGSKKSSGDSSVVESAVKGISSDNFEGMIDLNGDQAWQDFFTADNEKPWVYSKVFKCAALNEASEGEKEDEKFEQVINQLGLVGKKFRCVTASESEKDKFKLWEMDYKPVTKNKDIVSFDKTDYGARSTLYSDIQNLSIGLRVEEMGAGNLEKLKVTDPKYNESFNRLNTMSGGGFKTYKELAQFIQKEWITYRVINQTLADYKKHTVPRRVFVEDMNELRYERNKIVRSEIRKTTEALLYANAN
tara:strand:+ start:18358 stop:21813 length:3456 start_codon:yes stop_codon:yes gene_type:complete